MVNDYLLDITNCFLFLPRDNIIIEFAPIHIDPVYKENLCNLYLEIDTDIYGLHKN